MTRRLSARLDPHARVRAALRLPHVDHGGSGVRTKQWRRRLWVASSAWAFARRSVRVGLVASATLGAALVVAGCDFGRDEPAVETVSAAAAVEAPTPPGERLVLRRGNLAEPTSLDPIRAAIYPEYMIVGDMFVGLFTENAFGEPTPALAGGWRVSEDGLTWTFRLRDTQWSDGAPVTADDFVYGMRRVLAPESGSPFVQSLFIVEGAEAVHNGEDPALLGIKALAPDQLEVKLNYAAPYLPGLLAHYSMLPAPRHVIEQHGDAWVSPKHIVVNGAYTLTEWQAGEKVVLRKNTRFYDASNVCFDDIIYLPISDFNEAEQRIRDGELDLTPDIPGDAINAVRRALPEHVRVSAGLATSFVTFNTRRAPFSDVRVRQALAMMVQPDVIVRDVARSGQLPARAFVPPATANAAGGASASWSRLTDEARRARAIELLQEAGFGPATPLSLVYDHLDSRDNPLLAEHLQARWSGIADWVSVETVAETTPDHYAKVLAGEYDVADANWLPDYNDPHGFLSPFLSESGSVNLPGWSNTEYDELVAQSNAVLDFNQRARILAQAETILLEQAAAAPVWHLANASLVAPVITGWQENSAEINRSRYLCRVEPDAEAEGEAEAAPGARD